MKGNRFLVVLPLILAGWVFSAGVLFAQEPPQPPGDIPEIGEGGPGGHQGGPGMGGAQMGPGGHQGKQGMGPGGKGPMKRSPEEIAKMKRRGALRTTAEAYKNLADLYREQGKIDEAVVQMKKILELADKEPEVKEDPKVQEQIGHVYMSIAEMYMSKDRMAEAEAILNEGVAKVKTGNSEIASRLLLNLGNIYRKKGKTAEAEKIFQQIIELNSGALSGK